MKIAKCPGDCYKPHDDASVYGWAIHPEDSSICMSALVDRSIPYVGGIIGINILTGL